jgi:4-amino-4-deoxy-L-arabinose transferase-like glycosyltransferase
MEDSGRKPDRGLSTLWPGLVILLLMPSLLWICLDRSVWPWDSAWYGEVSIHLYLTWHHSFGEWIRSIWTALPNRGPGLVWLGELFLPAGISFGRPELGLSFCQWLIQAASACVLYRSAIILFADSVAAFAAVALLCSAPLFIGMTHTYMTEPIQGLACAIFVYVLCGVDRRPVLRSGLLLGLALVFATLGKVTSVLYLFCPLLLFVILLARRRSELWHAELDVQDVALAVALGAAGIICSYWIYRNFSGVVGHALQASSGAASEYYGSRSRLTYKLLYWMRAMLMSFLHPLVRPVLALGLLGAAWSRLRQRRSLAWADYVVLACAANIAFVILVFSLNVTEDTRFTFALLPCVGLVLAWIVADAPRWAAKGFFAVAMLQVLLVYASAYGVAAGSFGLSPYLLPVDTQGHRRALLEAALADSCDGAGDAAPTVVGLELPYFNLNSLSFYSTIASIHSGRKCAYVNLGYGDPTADQAWNTLLSWHPGTVLFLKDEVSHVTPGDPFNRVSHNIYDRVRGSPAFRLEPIPDFPDLILFRNSARAWRIRSALFRAYVSLSEDGHGTSTWRIHPARRESGEQTVLQFLGELPAHATISGRIDSCDQRCQGLAIEFETAGAFADKQEVLLPAPVQNRSFAVILNSRGGDSLTVRLQSPDSTHDSVDYCWLTVTDIRIQPARE